MPKTRKITIFNSLAEKEASNAEVQLVRDTLTNFRMRAAVWFALFCYPILLLTMSKKNLNTNLVEISNKMLRT
jgi:hypothetical protein